jgi:hypothetical protein
MPPPRTQARGDRSLARLALAAVALVLCLGGRTAAEEAAAPPLSTAQLEQLVAPIALYPDPLLSQMLMAATYPLEVAEAARWSQANPDFTGAALEDAMQQQPWDPDVKALTALPQTLQMMNDQLDWTQQLGDAFLAQQRGVLDAVQRLRARAEAAGNLETTPQQKVSRVAAPPEPGSDAPATTVYLIEPVTADEYAVPIYDPNVVYGAWPYPDRRPFYWHPPDFVASDVLSFATGVTVGSAIWGRADWWQHRVNINIRRYNQFNHANITRITWMHDPVHRRDVPYRDRNVAAQFSDKSKAAPRDASDTSARERAAQSKSSEHAERSKRKETSRSARAGQRRLAAHHSTARRSGGGRGRKR